MQLDHDNPELEAVAAAIWPYMWIEGSASCPHAVPWDGVLTDEERARTYKAAEIAMAAMRDRSIGLALSALSQRNEIECLFREFARITWAGLLVGFNSEVRRELNRLIRDHFPDVAKEPAG